MVVDLPVCPRQRLALVGYVTRAARWDAESRDWPAPWVPAARSAHRRLREWGEALARSQRRAVGVAREPAGHRWAEVLAVATPGERAVLASALVGAMGPTPAAQAWLSAVWRCWELVERTGAPARRARRRA